MRWPTGSPAATALARSNEPCSASTISTTSPTWLSCWAPRSPEPWTERTQGAQVDVGCGLPASDPPVLPVHLVQRDHHVVGRDTQRRKAFNDLGVEFPLDFQGSAGEAVDRDQGAVLGLDQFFRDCEPVRLVDHQPDVLVFGGRLESHHQRAVNSVDDGDFLGLRVAEANSDKHGRQEHHHPSNASVGTDTVTASYTEV